MSLLAVSQSFSPEPTYDEELDFLSCKFDYFKTRFLVTLIGFPDSNPLRISRMGWH